MDNVREKWIAATGRMRVILAFLYLLATFVFPRSHTCQLANKDVCEHIWNSRDYYLSKIEIPTGDNEEEKNVEMQKKMMQKIIQLTEDQSCVFYNKIGLEVYKTSLDN